MTEQATTASGRTRPDPSATQARVVAEALLAWRKDPTPSSWSRVFAALRAYEKASTP